MAKYSIEKMLRQALETGMSADEKHLALRHRLE
jgi:hypothetical protein